MSLNRGSRLGSYEIVSPLGAGGIGEAYRARDTKLELTVATQDRKSVAFEYELWARATRGPTSLKIDRNRGSPLENRLYCLLYTFVLFTASPLAFVPVWVMVMVLPSAETTAFAVVVAFPPFFQVFS